MAGSLMSRTPRGLAPLWSRDPWNALRDEMNELRSRFFGEEDGGWLTGTSAPSLDLAETDTTIDVRMDLPGVKAKDIDIQLNGNLLTVSAERAEEKEEKGKTFHRVERHSGRFSRTVSLPCPVNEGEVAADYHDGVLSITLPKTDESKAHKIKVKG